MRTSIMRAVFVCVALSAILYTAVVSAQSDLEPPTLVALNVSPSLIDTSSDAQAITITAHIRDLSGCSEFAGFWCLAVEFVPRFGPAEQKKTLLLGVSDLISGTLTDGIYEQAFSLPQNTYAGQWVLTYVHVSDRENNGCGLPSFRSPCPFDMPLLSFINRRADALNFMPMIRNPLIMSALFATATPTFTVQPD